MRNMAWEGPCDKSSRNSETRSPPFFLPMPSHCLYHMQTILSSRTEISTCGDSSCLCSTSAKGGNATLPSSLSPSPIPSVKGKRCRLTFLSSIQTISWEHHTLFYSGFPHKRWGAAHLQTPSGLNGDSCMQQGLLTGCLVQ